MPTHVGEMAAAGCAVAWALAVVCFARAGRTVPPVALNVLKNVLMMPLLIATLVFLGRDLLPAYGWWAYTILAISGFLGITIADTLLLASLNRIGAGWMALVSCAWAPMMVLVTAVGFGIPVTLPVVVGASLVAVAVLLATDGRDHGPHSRRQLLVGLGMGLFAQLLMAIGVAMLKYPIHGHEAVFDHTDILVVTVWRLIIGTLLLGIWFGSRSRRRALMESLRPSPAWRWIGIGSFLATYLAMILWMIGMKEISGSLARAAILNQTTAIYMPIFGALILHERVTRRKAAAIGVAFSGAIIVALSR